MKFTHKTSIEYSLDNGTTNKLTLENVNVGGSLASEFDPGNVQPLAGEKYYIKEVEKHIFELSNTNNFNEDIITLLQTPAVNITGFVIFAYQDEDGKRNTPIRFNVKLKLNTMGAAVLMSDTSEFSLQNITNNKIEELHVSDVVVPTGKVANLVILVVSNNLNQP